MRLTFRNGCGDCPSGCTRGRFWKFKVYYTNCSVKYLGDSSFNIFNAPLTDLSCLRGNIMPLDLISFSASEKNGYPHLNWVSENESHLKSYEVQQSTSYDFRTVGFVTPFNSATRKEYKWSDKEPLTKPARFRLKMIDTDGRYKFSNILQLIPARKISVIISPNPIANKQLNLSFSNTSLGDYVLQFYSSEGKLVFNKKLLVSNNSSHLIILPENIGTGTYVLKISSVNKENVLQQLVFVK